MDADLEQKTAAYLTHELRAPLTAIRCALELMDENGRLAEEDRLLLGLALRNTERLLLALSELPYGLARELDPEEVLGNPVTIVGDDPRVDILTVAWSVTFDRAYPNRTVRRIQGVRVPYLSLPDLIASKQTGRAIDRADIETLSR